MALDCRSRSRLHPSKLRAHEPHHIRRARSVHRKPKEQHLAVSMASIPLRLSCLPILTSIISSVSARQSSTSTSTNSPTQETCSWAKSKLKHPTTNHPPVQNIPSHKSRASTIPAPSFANQIPDPAKRGVCASSIPTTSTSMVQACTASITATVLVSVSPLSLSTQTPFISYCTNELTNFSLHSVLHPQ